MCESSFSQLKHQLEYFYLIPVDQIVNEIHSEIPSHRNINATQLDTIFRYVYKGASLYYDFIDADINHTFFNESLGDPLRCGLCRLLYLSLQNNCILNAYFDEQATASASIEFTGKNIPLIDKYITDLIGTNQLPKNLPGDVDSQFFNNRKKIYKDDLAQGIYTSTIINALNTPANRDAAFPIELLQYISPAASFLFMKDPCCKFARSLSDNTYILDKYNKLWNEYKKSQVNYSTPIDRLIFQAEIESIFGFSFFGSICSRLEEIHQMKNSNLKCLKDLEGQSFNHIILQIANLPIFFGKLLFFRYICHAFESSSNIDSSYFTESAKDVATYITPALHKSLQTINGLELMTKFFTILGSVSIPVLFSLWRVVIHELDLKCQISELYEQYLKSNIDMLTYDYKNLSDDKIKSFSERCLQQNVPFDNRFLRSELKAASITTDIDQGNIFPSKISPYLKETMQQLLHDYCNLDSLKNLRAPSFFLTGDELTSYSPLSRLVTSLQYVAKDYNEHSNYRKKSFLIDHRSSFLYEYLFSKE